MYDCEDCVRRLDQLVDKELSAPEVEEIHGHLDSCGDCTRRYRFQEGLKRLVKVSCDDTAPEALRERLKKQLKA
ncbi:MAG TPA: mycothiol system anti-sigma-R factor [Candidatus Dormibacteraeota bacterium]|nr:mycothiol system anti-sigma-R factor [Candidatus Dormibacteraeota bacterium]